MGSYGFSEDANVDLDEICDYLELRNAKLASQLFDRIREKCKLVAAFPEMGRSYEEIIPGLRGFVIDNYIIFYVVVGDSIQILRIVNGYRDIDKLFGQQ
jgi:toxin ParE1/3/4